MPKILGGKNQEPFHNEQEGLGEGRYLNDILLSKF